nr:hypothetical protein [uncultured Mediterranean phage uvMED]
MHPITFRFCIYSLSSFHMSLVLSIDELTTVRKWHLLNRTANEAYLQLETKKQYPSLVKVSEFKKRIKQHKREIEEVDYHMNNRAKWNDEVRSKQLKASV